MNSAPLTNLQVYGLGVSDGKVISMDPHPASPNLNAIPALETSKTLIQNS